MVRAPLARFICFTAKLRADATGTPLRAADEAKSKPTALTVETKSNAVGISINDASPSRVHHSGDVDTAPLLDKSASLSSTAPASASVPAEKSDAEKKADEEKLLPSKQNVLTAWRLFQLVRTRESPGLRPLVSCSCSQAMVDRWLLTAGVVGAMFYAAGDVAFNAVFGIIIDRF